MSSEEKKGRVWLAGGAGVLALLLAFAWMLGLMSGDPALAQLQRDFDAAARSGQPIPREQMRERMEGLTEEQRRAFFQQNRDTMRAMITQRMVGMLQLPREELQAKVRQSADRVIAARAERAANPDAGRRGPRGGRPGGGPPGGGPPGGGASGEGPPRGGPPGGRGGWGQMSASDRMKRVLEFTTPEMRGAFTEMKRMVDAELESRGQEPLGMREMRQVFRP